MQINNLYNAGDLIGAFLETAPSGTDSRQGGQHVGNRLEMDPIQSPSDLFDIGFPQRARG